MICTDGFIAGLPSFIDNLPDLLDPVWSWEVVTSPDAFMLRVKGVVPEPGTLVLLISGGLGLLLAVWRRKRS